MPVVTLKATFDNQLYIPRNGEAEMLINCPHCNEILIIPTPYKTPWKMDTICKNRDCGIIISVEVTFRKEELEYERTYSPIPEINTGEE